MLDEAASPSEAAPHSWTAPKVLLVAVLPYLLAARLAIALREVGFEVEAVCPNNHPLHLLRDPPRAFPLGWLGAASTGPMGGSRAVAKALLRSAPDLVIPCDDLAMAALHAIARRTRRQQIREVIEASLGPVRTYDILESRSAQVALARRLGVRTPGSVPLPDEASLQALLRHVRLPVFLKRDGTWAGQGVERVSDAETALRAFTRMSREHTLGAAVRQASTHGWRFSLSRVRARRPMIDLQSAVAGQPATVAVACRQGEVLAHVSGVAVASTRPDGPASMIRLVDNKEMRAAAVLLARELRASGLLGFDFVLDAKEEAHFLEINARATPIAALATRSGDLAAALFRAVSGRAPLRDRLPIAEPQIALFPGDLGRRPAFAWPARTYYDVPRGEPGLIAFGRCSVV